MIRYKTIYSIHEIIKRDKGAPWDVVSNLLKNLKVLIWRDMQSLSNWKKEGIRRLR